MKKISACLWFNDQAEEAVKFYKTVFDHVKVGKTARYGKSGAEVSGQKEGSVMTVSFEIEGFEFEGLNGGPMFKFTPAMSFFIYCKNDKEIKEKWKKLSDKGNVRMGLDKYPWAEQYGWVADRFGVEWQLIIGDVGQKIVPCFLFVDQLFGKGDEAIKYYTSIFKKSKVGEISYDEKNNSVMHGNFELEGETFALMDGPGKHGYTFNEATSLMVHCKTQEEIDFYWEKLKKGGSEGPCGWLKDKYGVSWQVVPADLGNWMDNPEKSEKVMSALLKMKKLDLATLKQAAK